MLPVYRIIDGDDNMFFANNRRARVIAVALLAALLGPLTTVSADYWEGGARTNGSAINGYALDLYAEISGVAGPIRESYKNWRGVNILRVNVGLYEFPTGSESPVDIVMFEPAYLIGTYSNGKGVPIAHFVPLVRRQNGTIVEADRQYPGSGDNVAWEYCEVVLFETGIRRKMSDWTVNGVVPPYATVAESIMTHEIGHTLKLAHPRIAPESNNGEGTGAGRNRPLPTNNARTIMERRVRNPYISELQLYDTQELRAKWGSI